MATRPHSRQYFNGARLTIPGGGGSWLSAPFDFARGRLGYLLPPLAGLLLSLCPAALALQTSFFPLSS